ncbi:hypothetical protein ACFVH6_21685 [Spirillospora sp. NPDC127200]
MSSTYLDTGAWPTGVTARYLTVGGGLVDITVEEAGPRGAAMRSLCSGCETEEWSRSTIGGDGPALSAHRESALRAARAWAQAHAERCRAMPRPEATSEETTR